MRVTSVIVVILCSVGAAALVPLPHRPHGPAAHRFSRPQSRCAQGPRAAVLGDSATLVVVADAAAQTADFSSVSLDDLGRDLLIFLTASVFVTPTARALNTNPILLFLGLGAVLGPHGLNIFSNTEADVEIGDFGVLFLLFSEGLEASPERLKSLTATLPVGLTQLGVTAAAITTLILAFSSTGVLGWLSADVERFIPLDQGFVDISNPAEALVLGLAAALSSSAFVFPVLQAKGWEERPAGVASKGTLLLQDLAIAPILVLLPFVLGSGNSDLGEFGILITKATVGFGAVLAVGSVLLRRVFRAVANAESSESFVALVVLVAVGMGAIAKNLGLTDTAGAFAAGVLLANSNFRAQIAADIVPFEGILLGIFFMTTGANFDAQLLLAEWPTVLVSTLLLLFVKAVSLGAAALVGRLPLSEALRFALLLAGGGEFAFVIFSFGERIGVLPSQLNGLLTGVVLISMSLTPLLAEAAEAVSAPLARKRDEGSSSGGGKISNEKWDESQGIPISPNATVVCGYNAIGQVVYRALPLSATAPAANRAEAEPREIVAFDLKPPRVIAGVLRGDAVVYGDGASVDVLRAAGVVSPRAIFVTYDNGAKRLSAVSRLREAFPTAKLFSRAATISEANALYEAGASECIDESEETAVQLAGCLGGDASSEERLRLQLQQQQSERSWTVSTTPAELRATAAARGVTERTARRLYALYDAMDLNRDGTVEIAEVRAALERSGDALDVDPQRLQRCLDEADADGDGKLDFGEFLEMFVTASDSLFRRATGDLSLGSEESEMPDESATIAADAGFGQAEAEGLYALYMSLDKDGNGEVEIAEVRALLSKSQVGVRSDDEMDSWLSQVDADGDGKLDFAEFLKVYGGASSATAS